MKAPPASEQPTYQLRNWIFAEARGHYFLVGYNLDLTMVRRSTPLMWVDVDNLSCCTMSGRLYELELPWAAGDVVNLLLEFFQESQGFSAVDSTLALLGDADLIYKKFVVVDEESGRLVYAGSRLQKMVEEPLVWLRRIEEILTKNDVPPEQIKWPLGLSDLQWKSYQKGTLSTVPMACAFRGLLVEQIFAMAAQVIDAVRRSNFLALLEILPKQIPAGVLDAREIHELFNEYRALIRHVADIKAELVIIA